MKKAASSILILCILLLMVTFTLAQTPRDGTSSEGKTSFGNIAVTGLNKNGTANNDQNPGIPGYIELRDGSGATWYLWVATTGGLRIASGLPVGLGASPTTNGWHDASGKVVGQQTH